MTAQAPTAALRGLVGYDPSLDEEILRFNREGYPERRADWVEPRWRWMFLESARRLGVAPMVWMYRARTGVVAHQGAIAVRLRAGGQEVTTGWFVETMVLESHRGKAVGPMVVKKALEDLPLNLSLGQTADMRSLQFALGWVEVGPLKEYAYVLKPVAVLQGKVPSPLRPFAALALSARQRLQGCRGPRRLPAGVTSRAVASFGAAHDRLWERVRDRFGCAVVRDASYLNWKYVDQPGQSFTRLEIERAGELVAVIVVMIRDHEPGYAYTRGFVVDLVVDPSDVVAVAAALRAGCDALAECGAALVRFDLLNEPLTNQLRAFGFTERGAERVLLVATGGADRALATAVTNPSAWLLTASDSDIDRPW